VLNCLLNARRFVNADIIDQEFLGKNGIINRPAQVTAESEVEPQEMIRQT
jgi:hypothetical protein